MHTEQGVQIRLTRVNRVTRVTRREFFGGKCLVEKISGNIFVRKQSAFREGRKYKEDLYSADFRAPIPVLQLPC